MPFGHQLAIKQSVGGVPLPNDRNGSKSRDAFAGAGKAKNCSRHDLFAFGAFDLRRGGAVRLWVVDQNEVRAVCFAVRRGFVHPPDPAHDTATTDGCTGGYRFGDRRENQFLTAPTNHGSFTLARLSVPALGDPLQSFDWVGDLGEVVQ